MISSTTKTETSAQNETANLALYHFEACPFCARVRGHINHLGLDIEYRDIRQDRAHRQALIAGGGKPQVPALRIEQVDGTVEWLYESLDIIDWLDERFGDK